MSNRRKEFKAPNIQMGKQDRKRDKRRIRELENQLVNQMARQRARAPAPPMPMSNPDSPVQPFYQPEMQEETDYFSYMLRFVFLAMLGVFTFLLWKWMKDNPRKCARKECVKKISANDNALRVVATQLAAGPIDKDGKPTAGGCSTNAKSVAVQAALSKTIGELDYE